jgi:hypothetical protein
MLMKLRRLSIFVWCSVVYVAGVFLFAAWKDAGLPANERMALNEWGDYFTGFISPLALAWFVVTAFLQRGELGLQRSELELQRKEMVLQREEMARARDVWSDQQKEQKRTADAYLEANRIARENSFAANIPYLMRKMEMLGLRLCKAAGYGFHNYNNEHFDALKRLAETLPDEIKAWQTATGAQKKERADRLLKIGASEQALELIRFFDWLTGRAGEAASEFLIILEAELAYKATMRCAEAVLWIAQEHGMPLEMKNVD